MPAFDVALIGGVCVDITGAPDDELTPRSSTPGSVQLSVGGVAHNVAANLARLGLRCAFVSAVGSDPFGSLALDALCHASVDCSGVAALSGGTGIYMSINDSHGEMQNAVADMRVLSQIDHAFIASRSALLESAQALFIDTNLERETIEYIASTYAHKPIFCDPVSITKSARVVGALGGLHLIKPNLDELEALTGTRRVREGADILLAKGAKNVVISAGAGKAYYFRNKACASVMPPPATVQNVNGAGDAFVAGLIYAHMKNYNPGHALKCAIAASRIALASGESVSDKMSEPALIAEIDKIERK